MTNPEKTFESGNCRAAVFYNEVKKDGKATEIPNVTITKRYLDKDNKWKNTNTFGINDIPKLIAVAMKTYDYLTSKKNE